MSTSSLSPAQKLDLSDPDKFQLASAVIKNSRSGITSHKRLLVIKKGYLYYYSNVPKKFKGDASIVQTIHQLPKCSIQIVNIKQIKGYQSNSSYFSIEFQSRNMLQRQDIRKTMTLQQYNFSPKHTTQTIVWQFTCDNQFIKQRWVAALEGLHMHYTKQKKDIEKFFNQNSNMSEMKSSSSGGRDSRVPWRQSQSQSGGNNNRGSYKRYGQVSFLQLVGTKSTSDQRQKSKQRQLDMNRNSGGKNNNVEDRSKSPLGKMSKTVNNYLNVPSNNNGNSKILATDNSQSNNQSNKVQKFDHSPEINENKNNNTNFNTSKLNPFQIASYSSSQSESGNNSQNNSIDRNIIMKNSNNNNIQRGGNNNININNSSNSPIKGLQFSQIVQNQGKQHNGQQVQQSLTTSNNNNNNKLTFSKTSTVQINDQQQQQNQQQQQRETNYVIKQQSQNVSLNKQGIKNKQKGQSGQQQAAGEFQRNLLNLERQNYHYKNQTKVNKSIDKSNPKLKDNNNYTQDIQTTQTNQYLHSATKQHKNTSILQSLTQLTFYQLHKYIFSTQLTFHQRIQVQKQLHFRVHEFATQSTKMFMQYVEGLGSYDNKDMLEDQLGFDVLYKANNMRVMKHQQTKTLYKIAFVTSQPLTINSQQRLYFDQQPIKNLKRQYKVINDLQKYVIMPQMKNNPTFRLRIPLCVLVQYKGVVGLVIDDRFGDGCGGNHDKHNSKDQKNGLISLNKQTRGKYQKQFDALISNGYDLKDFVFKSQHNNNNNFIILRLLPEIVTNKLTTQQIKKTYLKRLLLTKQIIKNHNIQFNPPFTHKVITKSKQSYASTSLQSLQFYLQTLQKVEQFSSSQSVCSKQQIMQFLQNCVFVKQLRKLYRSCQGELQETHFMSLVFAGDEGMKQMLEQAGCDNVPKMTGLVLDLIQYYLGVIIKVDVNKLSLFKNQQQQQHQQQQQSKPNKSFNKNTNLQQKISIISTQCKPIIHTINLFKIQIEQTFTSIGRFLQQNNLKLVKNAINIISTLQYQLFPLTLNEKMLQLTNYKAQLAYKQSDYLGCIQLCNHYVKMVNNFNNPKLFETYLLMLKAYTHVSSDQFLFIYDRLLNMIIFNYGQQSSVLIGVYNVGAFLLRGVVVGEGQKGIIKQQLLLQQYNNNLTKQTNNLFVLGSKLIQQAQLLCSKIFGLQSQQYIDLLLDIVRFYSNINQQKQQIYKKKVKNLITLTNNTNKLVDFMLLQLKQLLFLDKRISPNGNRDINKNQNKYLMMIEQCERIIMLGNKDDYQRRNDQTTSGESKGLSITKLSSINTKRLIQLQQIKFKLGMKQLPKGQYLIEHAILILWYTENYHCRKEAIIMIAKWFVKSKFLINNLKMTVSDNYQSEQYNDRDSQQDLMENNFDYGSLRKDLKIQQAIDGVLQLMSSDKLSNCLIQHKSQNVIIKMKLMIEQQKLLSNKQNHHNTLSFKLNILSKYHTHY